MIHKFVVLSRAHGYHGEVRSFPEDRQKLKELILYISERSQDDPHYGGVKLNKLLFFADFYAYARLGKPITGAEYMREKFGPIPKRLIPARDELIAEGALAIQNTQLSRAAVRKRPVSLRSAVLGLFSAEEIAIVEWVIRQLRRANATRISDHTHTFALWLAAKDGETIPYEAMFVSDSKLTDAEIERGRGLAVEHGWLAPTAP